MSPESPKQEGLRSVSPELQSSIETPSLSNKQEKSAVEGNVEDETVYPTGKAVAVIMSSVWICMFLIALDKTIIATAIPKITDQFHSLQDVGWYGSSYMLTSCSVQLVFGRIYKFYSTKWVFLWTLVLFELGSAICGAAPNSVAFIIGRAIAGLGSSGIAAGAMLIMVHVLPLHKRPIWSGFLGATFGVASVVGPLLGGVFTDRLTWRWCFFINLPLGAIAFVVVLLILKVPPLKDVDLTFTQKMAKLDPWGTICLLPCIISLILALQWGGTTYAWSSGRVIGLLVVFSVLFVCFVAIQIWQGESGMVPPRILTQRSIACGSFYTFTMFSANILIAFYLPTWFQAIKGTSALESGIRSIPTILSLVVAAGLSGFVTTKIGYYVPAMLLAPIVASIGAGLLTTLSPSSGHAEWIGYQVIFGFGSGLALMSANLAAQAVLSKDDVSIGSSIIFFAKELGGALFVSVGLNVFINSLVSGLEKIAGLDAQTVADTGATEIAKMVPSDELPAVLNVYNYALTRLFFIGVGMSAVSILGSVGMEWKSVKEKKVENIDEAANAEKESV